jgi:transcriptional regulator with XRE-family HTH domain
MSTDPGTVRSPARFLFVTLANRVRELSGDLAVRLKAGGRSLDGGQRLSLLRDWRLELETEVEDAENHGIPDEGARRISLTRSLIRWLERGELPGPDAIPFLEKQLAGIGRDPEDHELAERAALVAAIHELGGDDRAAAGIWREPAPPDVLAGYGRTLHRLMRRAGLTVAELADRADLEPSEVVAFLYGTEEARASETLKLAGALGVGPGVLLEGAKRGSRERPGRDAGLNRDRPGGTEEDGRP